VLAMIAAFALAFGCFLRMGELTYDIFDPRFDLRRDCIDTSTPDTRISIPASKTDPFRVGITVVILEGPPGPYLASTFDLEVRANPARPTLTASFNRTLVAEEVRRRLVDSLPIFGDLRGEGIFEQ